MRISGEKIPTRADPARGQHAEPAFAPLGPPALSQCRRQRPLPGSGGHFWRDTVHRAAQKKKALSAHVSGWNWLCQVCLWRISKENSQNGPYLVASLKS